MPWLIVLSLLLILAAILVLRAAFFRPKSDENSHAAPIEVNAEAAAAHLSQMIQKRTVWNRNVQEIDAGEFKAFIGLLAKLYPETHRTLQLEIVNEYALLYRWSGKTTGAPTVLMAHYDVVAAEENGWRHPPFGGVIENGVVWGRGAIDTKVTLCAILESVEQLLREGFVPEHDIYLSFANNEETAGDSTPAIATLFRARGIEPALILDEGGAVVEHVFPGVSSPVALVGVAEKGITDVEISVIRPGGHASTPPPETATVALAKAIVTLNRHPFRAHFPKPTIHMLTVLGRRTPFAYRFIFANLWLFKPLLLKVFTKSGGEMNAMTRTTLSVTMLEASKGANVLAPQAKATANVRIAVGESVEGVVSHMKAAVKGTGAAVKTIYESEPSPVSDTKGPAFALLQDVIHGSFPDAVISPYVMLGGSDSRHFARFSPYVYRFTPLELTKQERESMHAVNECLPVEKLKKCEEFYTRLIQRL